MGDGGITSPLHKGQWLPQPAPEPVARTLFVQYFELESPLDMVPATHKRLMACTPNQPKSAQSREILARFAGKGSLE